MRSLIAILALAMPLPALVGWRAGLEANVKQSVNGCRLQPGDRSVPFDRN